MNIHEILKRDEKPLIRFWASSVRVRDRRTHMSTVEFSQFFILCLTHASFGRCSHSPTAFQFLPRDAMHKRGLCCHAVSVCVSVRLSVTFVDHVKTITYLQNFFTAGQTHHSSFFLCQTAYSDGDPPNVGVECKWGRLQCLLLVLQQARCCQQGRRWTTATVSQVVTHRWQ